MSDERECGFCGEATFGMNVTRYNGQKMHVMCASQAEDEDARGQPERDDDYDPNGCPGCGGSCQTACR